jgi:hypothetical protein
MLQVGSEDVTNRRYAGGVITISATKESPLDSSSDFFLNSGL